MRAVVVVVVLFVAASPALSEPDGGPSASDAGAADDEVDDWGEGWDEDDFAVIDPANSGAGAADAAPGDGDVPALNTTIFGDPEERRRIAGSADEVTEEDLERHEHDDPTAVLAPVPGVYVRTEDGYGLRPNIGMRGASSDRSAKITLMEDGVLFAPAPYAAPAAYYFPLITRMTGLEVFKGPAAIRYGPQTVGGALNLRTRPIPLAPFAGGVDVAAGAYGGMKGHGFAGGHVELPFGFVGGVLLEGAHVRSDGFKRLDGGGPTGFDRSDLMFKSRLGTGALPGQYHSLELKLGYGNETSHETYLGLTDADFRLDARRRYVGSELDLMQWDRTQVELSYGFSLLGAFDLQLTAYRHDFDRAWRKLNRFAGGPSLSTVLKNPDGGVNEIYMAVLRGQRDSDSESQELMIGTNARRFVAQGAQGILTFDFALGPVTNFVEVGARLHNDSIERQHTEQAHAVRAGHVVTKAQGDLLKTAHNRGEALAGALYANDELAFGDLLVVPGIRLELIQTDFVDHLRGEDSEQVQFVWLPGVGASYTVLDALTVLAGVHKGFSPVSPGQSPDTLPEESINYETGARLKLFDTSAELIGFFNQYMNLTGECTFSTGCGDELIGKQFNGGEVWVYGFEAKLSQGVRLPYGMWLQLDAAYTFTWSDFRTAFRSQNPQFGDVEVGDQLAYVPVHQGATRLLFAWRDFELASSMGWATAMRDVASQGDLVPAESTDAYRLVDVVSSYALTEHATLYVKLENVLDERYLAARRPFGARPGKPASYMAGLKLGF